jgi:hypothetical protein
VPQGYKEDPKLANWVNSQRTVFKNGTMNPERKRMLDEIGFDFKPTKGSKENERRWNLQFKKLQNYYEEHGDCE